MPHESPRIAELRRRIENDPSSIAFAQLAEEYRRAGDFEAAEEVCRTGLARHPAYLSARVTLGRTLIERGKLEDAASELEQVLRGAPDNLAAIRGMAEIHRRLGHLEDALEYYRRALPLARHDPELEEVVQRLSREVEGSKAPVSPGPSFEQTERELISAAARIPEATIPAPVQVVPEAPPPGESDTADQEALVDFDKLLESLGSTEHSAPPIVEALLKEPAPPTADATGAALESSTAASEPVAPGEPVATDPDQNILDELEAWLAAIKR